jgi:hypothetical protein
MWLTNKVDEKQKKWVENDNYLFETQPIFCFVLLKLALKSYMKRKICNKIKRTQ